MNNNKTKIKKWHLGFLLFLFVGTVYVLANQRNAPYQKEEGVVFGTTYHIVYQNNEKLTNKIKEALDEIDSVLSPFNDSSIISKINTNETVQTNKMFTDVFSLAYSISEETNGSFDATVAPLVNAWGFGFKNSNSVTNVQIDSIMNFVGYKKIMLKNNGRIEKTNPNVMLDFGAIAKGYACDVIAKLLKSYDIRNFMVEIGGEIVAFGVNPDKKDWHIGIASPIENNDSIDNTYQAVLSLKDASMATSGNYRNFYIKDGKKYAHTIDPHTGHPVQHSLLSATVIAPSCAIADAYATAFMVMGIEKAKTILSKHKELNAFFIYVDDKGENKVWHSASLTPFIMQ